MGNEQVQRDLSDRIGLDEVKRDSKRISSDWLLMPVHDSTIKTPEFTTNSFYKVRFAGFPEKL